jgi:hypothetical protein
MVLIQLRRFQRQLYCQASSRRFPGMASKRIASRISRVELRQFNNHPRRAKRDLTGRAHESEYYAFTGLSDTFQRFSSK